MRTFKFLLIISVTFIFSCTENSTVSNGKDQRVEISPTDTALHLINGIFYYRSLKYTGDIKEIYHDGLLKSIQHLQDGKQEGLAETFYEDGKPESSRWYTKGEKDSTQTGWWENGNIKYEYHFKNGTYNGMFTEWYQSGRMLQQVMYAHGNEVYGRGWRESAKLYMNFVMKDGRRYGLNNSNLCYTLDRETVRK